MNGAGDMAADVIVIADINNEDGGRWLRGGWIRGRGRGSRWGRVKERRELSS